ncbi:S8 family serine peptidase [Thermodesulfobacteriota bacterium]
MSKFNKILFIFAILVAIVSHHAFAAVKAEKSSFALEVKDRLINLQAESTSFKEILKKLEEKTGIKIKIFEGVKDKKVSLDVKSLPIYAVGTILEKMSLKNFAVVYDDQLSSVAIFILPEGKDISQFIKGKSIVSHRNFPIGKTIDTIKDKKIISTTKGKNKAPIRYMKDEILLKFHLGVSNQEIQKILQKHNLKLSDGKLSKLGYIKVKIPDERNVTSVIREIRKEYKLKVPEPNYITNILTVSDPLFNDQWYIPDINFDQAWEKAESKHQIKLAVIDSGVDAGHPDLKGKILNGIDFVNDDIDPFDDHGHGTFVSGIITANANDIGIKGLYGQARIIPIKVIDQNGLGTYEDVAQGILYAADNGAKVINLSIGGYSYSFMLQEAVDYALEKGCIVVAAGGNDGIEQEIYPAAYPDVIGVSALGYNEEIWQDSNSGRHIDVSAPGVDIISTGTGGNYVYASGTSASSAMVTALAAMLLSEKPDLSVPFIEKLIMQSAKDLGEEGRDKIYGSGEIDAFAALEQDVEPFHDVAVKSVSIEPMVFELDKPTHVVANIQNTGSYRSENFDIVLYEVIGKEKKEIGKKEGITVIGKIRIIFDWEPEVIDENVKFEVSVYSAEDTNSSNNLKTTSAFLIQESDGLYVLHHVDIPVHQWIAYQAADIWSNTEINNHIEDYSNVWGGSDPYLDNNGFGYDSNLGDDEGILIGCGEEDKEDCDCEGYYKCDYHEHFWDPDVPQNGNYDLGIESPTRYSCFGSYVMEQHGSAYNRAQYLWNNFVIPNYPSNKPKSYYYLGRVAHLLIDMTVPAHVHNDLHALIFGGDDSFEYTMLLTGLLGFNNNYWGEEQQNYLHFSGSDYAGQEYEYEAEFFDSMVKTNPTNLFKLFWYTAQKTQYFASDPADGKYNTDGETDGNNWFAFENGTLYYFPGDSSSHYDYLWESEGVSIVRYASSLADDDDFNWGDDLKKIAEANIPHAMKAVAGLYRLFWHETLHPPSNVSASDSTYPDRIRITWTDDLKVEHGFRIYRSDSQYGSYSLIGTTSANATSYNDYQNCGGTPYWYMVRAYSTVGESENSNIDSGYTNDCLHKCSDMSKTGEEWDEEGSAGDGDGVVEVDLLGDPQADEKPRLNIRLRSAAGADNVIATLYTDDQDINIIHSEVYYQNFSPGESQWSVEDFEMELNFNLDSCNQTRTGWFTLHITYELDGELCYQAIPISKTFYKDGCISADFSVNGPVLIDDDPSYLYRNDGDGVFESGEKIHIRPQVCNVGSNSATDPDIGLYYSGEGNSPIEIESGDDRYEDLATDDCGYHESSDGYYKLEAINKSFTGPVDIGIRVNWDENNQTDPIEIPDAFQLYVHPAPAISVTSDYYFGTLCSCEVVAYTAQVYNGGSSTLIVTSIQTSHVDTVVNPSGTFTLEPGESREVFVTIDTCSIEDGTEVSRTITVNSNGKLTNNDPPSNIFVITGMISCPRQLHQVPGVTRADYPDISGDWIVYEDDRNGNWDIFAYQISTGDEKQITTDSNSQRFPRIQGGLIVWKDWRNDDGSWSNSDIFGYDLSTEQEFVVSDQPVMERLIGVDNNLIAFTQRYETLYDGDGTLGGYASNLVVYEYQGGGQTQQLYSTGWTPGSGHEARQTVDDDGDFGNGMLVFERYVFTWLDQNEIWSISEVGRWVEIIDFAKGETAPHWAKDSSSILYSAAQHRFVFVKEYEDAQGDSGDQVWLWDDGSIRRLTEPGTEEIDHGQDALAIGNDLVVYDKKGTINERSLFFWDLAANQADYPEFLLTDQMGYRAEKARMEGSAVVWRAQDTNDLQWYIYYAFFGKRLSVSPSSLDFGSAAIDCSFDRSVAITNSGNEDLQVGDIAQNNPLGMPFSIIGDNCSGTIISPEQICMLTIRFSPDSEGAYSDSFDIPSNDADNNPMTITVEGIGAADNDNDCIPNDQDGCPDDPNKAEPGICGCGTPDIDTDRDEVLDCNDAFPYDPDYWLDADGDGMPDDWEQQIVNKDPNDGIETINQVLPGDDFDKDGWSNIIEYQRGTDPTNSESHPSGAMPWIPLLLLDE